MSEDKQTEKKLKYIKIKTLGEGAFGTAVLCKSPQGDKCVVKKIKLNAEQYKDPDALKLAKQEGKLMKMLYHPNIVSFQDVYYTGKNENQMNIVMEYMNGGELQQEIDKKKKNNYDYYSEIEVYSLFTQICLGLKSMHDYKIIHRDLKAENIFLTKNGIAKIGDLGICKLCNTDSSQANTKIGTPMIMAPEQLDNQKYGRSADIWALGIILYQLCCLESPFSGNSLPNLAKSILKGKRKPIPEFYGDNINNLLNSLLQRNPKDRPSINTILKFPKIWEKVGGLLQDKDCQEEFMSGIQKKPMKEKIKELKRIQKRQKEEDKIAASVQEQISSAFDTSNSTELDQQIFSAKQGDIVESLAKTQEIDLKEIEKGTSYSLSKRSTSDVMDSADATIKESQEEYDADLPIDEEPQYKESLSNSNYFFDIINSSYAEFKEYMEQEYGPNFEEGYKILDENYEDLVIDDNAEDKQRELLQHLNLDEDKLTVFTTNCQTFIMAQKMKSGI